MHEVGLMQETMRIVFDQAEKADAEKITEVRMRVGELSGVVPVSLTFAFGIVTEGTIASNARLEIEEVPLVCYCEACREEFHPADVIYICPKCGQPTSTIRSGRELQVVSIEVE